MYQDVLGRPIDDGGKTTFTQLLAKGTTRTQVATILDTSDEFRRNLIQADYQHFLMRAADSGGLNNFLKLLQNGARDEDVAAQIAGSVEYYVNASAKAHN